MWKIINDIKEIPEYDWHLLGEEDEETGNFVWQIGRRIGEDITFFDDYRFKTEVTSGPLAGDAFGQIINRSKPTHWMKIDIPKAPERE